MEITSKSGSLSDAESKDAGCRQHEQEMFPDDGTITEMSFGLCRLNADCAARMDGCIYPGVQRRNHRKPGPDYFLCVLVVF
jgi:hypothetical protein